MAAASRPACTVFLASLLVCLLLAPAPAHAVWPHDPSLGNLPVSTAASNQSSPAAISDGAGGMIVSWTDTRGATGADIYVQRISAAGTPMWTADGVAVSTANSDQQYSVLISDGAGGAIIAWQDGRSGTSDIYAQRVNVSGVPQWTANGVAVCTATNVQLFPVITTDGAGGAIIAWTDARAASVYDIYAQRLNGAGARQWTLDGVPVCVATGDQQTPVILSDGASGAYIAWIDLRSGASNDIYGQRINSAGAPLGTVDGISLCNATGSQTAPVIASDGAGAAFVAWVDARVTGSDIYINRIQQNVFATWANGLPVCTATNAQFQLSITADGAGGAIMAWTDQRSGFNDLYAQRMNSGGTMQWAANGVAFTGANDQTDPEMVGDGAGGAWISWTDNRNGTLDIYAQRVDDTGTPLWTAGGIPVSTAPWTQSNATIISDGSSGCVMAWQDGRGFSTYDIYAQRIDQFGYMGAEPAITSVRDVKNDEGGQVKVSWNASWLDGARDPNLTAYSVFRSVPSSGALAALRRGARLMRAQGYAWEFLASVNAAHVVPSYSFVAPTTGDSIAGSNPMTAFLIVARNSNSTYQWASAPDSGYSVDNLGPITPAPFNGNYAGGATHLHWDPNHESDLAGYRLYRGNSAGFVPGPGNLVSAQPDTGFSDSGAAGSYYKLSAVDIHGNESPFAILGPNGTTDVPHPPFGFALGLTGAVPNPAIGVAEIQFTLAREGFARVQILDAAGRLVRDVSSARLPAGPNTVRWDARRSDGTRAAAGLYFVRLEVGGRTLIRRMALMR